MDNKVTKQRIVNHLEYDWFKYIILIIVGIVAVVFTFQQINRNKEDEDFTIFFTAYSARENTYVADISAEFELDTYDSATYGPNIFREMSIEFQSPDSSTYGELYSTHGEVLSDVLIVHKSYFEYQENDGDKTYFSVFKYLQLNDDILKLLGIEDKTSSEYEFMCVDKNGKRVDVTDEGAMIYGIRIDNLSKIDSIAQLKKETDDGEIVGDEYYLYFSRDKANIGQYNPKNKKPENKQAFYCVKRFLEKYGPVVQ